MIISRIKQGLIFLLSSYNKKNDIEIKNILNEEEFNIFDKMSEYDKIHSFNLYKNCSKNKILKDDENYLKLALLHDCGKENYSLFRRIKKVLVGDEILEKHPKLAYEKLKNINLEVAKLALVHHNKAENEKMREFQRLDSK